MTLALSGGGLGVLASSLTDWTCPFRVVGLACPGCGCGRAVSLFVNEGLGAVFISQPTAGLLLFIMSVVLVVSLVGSQFGISLRREALIIRISSLALFVAGMANLVYQIRIET